MIFTRTPKQRKRRARTPHTKRLAAERLTNRRRRDLVARRKTREPYGENLTGNRRALGRRSSVTNNGGGGGGARLAGLYVCAMRTPRRYQVLRNNFRRGYKTVSIVITRFTSVSVLTGSRGVDGPAGLLVFSEHYQRE